MFYSLKLMKIGEITTTRFSPILSSKIKLKMLNQGLTTLKAATTLSYIHYIY